MTELAQIGIRVEKCDAEAYSNLLREEARAGGSAATLFSRMLATVTHAGRHAEVELRAERLEDGSVRVYGIGSAKADPGQSRQQKDAPKPAPVDKMAEVAKVIHPIMEKIGIINSGRRGVASWYCYRDFSMRYGLGVRAITNQMLDAGILVRSGHGKNRYKKAGPNDLGNVVSEEYLRRFVDKSWIRKTY